jgi:hypothetical protein
MQLDCVIICQRLLFYKRYFIESSFIVQVCAFSLYIPHLYLYYVATFTFTFHLSDVSGASLVAVHYTVNSPISGVNPGKWNYDIRSKTGTITLHQADFISPTKQEFSSRKFAVILSEVKIVV